MQWSTTALQRFTNVSQFRSAYPRTRGRHCARRPIPRPPQFLLRFPPLGTPSMPAARTIHPLRHRPLWSPLPWGTPLSTPSPSYPKDSRTEAPFAIASLRSQQLSLKKTPRVGCDFYIFSFAWSKKKAKKLRYFACNWLCRLTITTCCMELTLS